MRPLLAGRRGQCEPWLCGGVHFLDVAAESRVSRLELGAADERSILRRLRDRGELPLGVLEALQSGWLVAFVYFARQG